MKRVHQTNVVAIGCGLLALLCAGLLAADKRPLTVQDMMHFRQIQRPVIADEGGWVAYTARPDRGDPEGVVVSARRGRTHLGAGAAHPRPPALCGRLSRPIDAIRRARCD